MQASSGVFTPFIASTLVLLLQSCGEAPTATSPTAPAASVATTSSSAGATASMYSDLEGNPINIADYAGKNVFVNYWATWCAPCIQEIPSIARAAEALGDDYVFLLASDESLDTIKDFLLDREFSGNFVKLNGYVGAIGINVMPTSVLYDASGTQVKSWEGSFEWDSAEMLAQLRVE
jgi:thiol-disulfide isomerase/thioredoxin